MVCSICLENGHNKKVCPTLRTEEAGVPIDVPSEVAEKMDFLASLCSEVASGLGKGHVEGVYQQALCAELQENDVRYVSEETIPILYKGVPIGGGHSQRLDVVLSSYLPGFIFELKAVSSGIKPEHHCQLMRYMVYKQQSYGAVVNFSQSDRGQLEVQFVVERDDTYYLYNFATGYGTPMKDFELSAPPSPDSVSTVASVSLAPPPPPVAEKPLTVGQMREMLKALTRAQGGDSPVAEKKPLTIAELREIKRASRTTSSASSVTGSLGASRNTPRPHCGPPSSHSVWSAPSIWIGGEPE
jgi:GxxExxY protein